MARRSYGQICGVARALDVLGERWTFLIVRDLLISPRRFKDLAEGLPGIGTNLLADRLQRLEELGLVERVKEAGEPRAVTLYRPTPAGRAAEPILHELMRWAWWHLPEAPDSALSDPSWTVLALRARFDPAAAEGVSESYEFRIDDLVFHADVEEGTVGTDLGPADAPAVTFTAGDETLQGIAAGKTSVEEALQARALKLEGAPAAVRRLFDIFPAAHTSPVELPTDGGAS